MFGLWNYGNGRVERGGAVSQMEGSMARASKPSLRFEGWYVRHGAVASATITSKAATPATFQTGQELRGWLNSEAVAA